MLTGVGLAAAGQAGLYTGMECFGLLRSERQLDNILRRVVLAVVCCPVLQEDFEMSVAKVMKKDSDRNMSLKKLWK